MNPIEILKQAIDKKASHLWDKDITLSRNDILVRTGSTDNWIYYVESGALRICVESENEIHTTRFAYRGSLVAVLDSFFRDTPTIYSIEAIRKSKVIRMNKNDFKAFVFADTEYTRLWQLLLEELILQQLEREIDLLHNSPAERYQRVYERSPHLFQEIPHKYIAAYLRMTPETLSRLHSNNR
ncbi:Crp/Fnr family transcriptional regulator [Bernardetia sp.]|uniref:Crp/Fnr family transcriptional regulator n=1 Tax=Bernardetia sp. TaxID=1937974 RepID=UPI0025BAE8E4|nr:Crp/Fnr family transcriptional regulator [Bernardetia sp.]